MTNSPTAHFYKEVYYTAFIDVLDVQQLFHCVAVDREFDMYSCSYDQTKSRICEINRILLTAPVGFEPTTICSSATRSAYYILYKLKVAAYS